MPITTVIYSVALAVTSVFDFLTTPAGQRQVELWISDQERMRKDFEKLGAWFEKVFEKQ